MDHFALVLPDEPTAVRLMNTLWADRGRVRDGLCEPGHLARWVAVIRPDVQVEDTDLGAFRALRDALHVIARHHIGDHGHHTGDHGTIRDALAVVNRAVADAPSRPECVLTPDGLSRRVVRSGSPVERLLADIAVEAFDLVLGDDLGRCQAHGCVHFYTLKPRHRQWCSAKCGNRVRVARHHQRRREDA